MRSLLDAESYMCMRLHVLVVSACKSYRFRILSLEETVAVVINAVPVVAVAGVAVCGPF